MSSARVFRRAHLLAGLMVLTGLGLAVPAEAARPVKPLGCGSTVTASTTLTADIGPCRRGGLTIGADGITLDLGGHTVFGINRTGDDSGVHFDAVTGSTVTNGTVQAFDIGVLVSGGGGNTVTSVTAQNNVGTGRLLAGEGISIQASSHNVVTGNTVTGNGPWAGISIVNDSADLTQVADANEISNNVIADNNNQSGNINQNQVDGIRIEGPNATNTLVSGNSVSNSGLDGIAVFADQGTGARNSGTQILGNTVTGNGFNDEVHRKGDGIVLFGSPTNVAVGGADNTVVQGNTVTGNAAHGIRVASQNNILTSNTTTGNAAVTTTAFDLTDSWPACDNNAWTSNTYGTRSQECIN